MWTSDTEVVACFSSLSGRLTCLQMKTERRPQTPCPATVLCSLTAWAHIPGQSMDDTSQLYPSHIMAEYLCACAQLRHSSMTAYSVLDTYVLHHLITQMCKAYRAAADASRADHAMVTAVAIHIQNHATGRRHFTICA